MCEIDPETVFNHWAGNWSKEPEDINPEEENIFLYKKKDNYLLKDDKFTRIYATGEKWRK
jgi:hypothetical protein